MRPILLLAAAGTLASCTAAAGAGEISGRDTRACAPPRLTSGYVQRVTRALRAKQDVWGNELLTARGGPTYERARQYLNQLLLAKAAKGKTTA